jgi:hypothetical protein
MQRALFAAFLGCAVFVVAAADAEDLRANQTPERTGAALVPAPSEAAIAKQVSPEPASLTRIASMEEICAVLAESAGEHELPLPFFVRLIWQESGFRSNVVSSAGAQGIAQFMPATAEWRGLTNPHDPIQSLRKSADYLRELWQQFGNLGLAAAAYNGGSGRVQAWLDGHGGLPLETRSYVQIVTGISIDRWRDSGDDSSITTKIPADIPCPVMLAAVPASDLIRVARPAPLVRRDTNGPIQVKRGGWGVIVAGDFSGVRARAEFARVQRQFRSIIGGRQPTVVTRRIPGRGTAPVTTIRIDEPDRTRANRLCARLRAGGANCMVMRSS